MHRDMVVACMLLMLTPCVGINDIIWILLQANDIGREVMCNDYLGLEIVVRFEGD